MYIGHYNTYNYMYKYYILFIAHFCQSTFSKALLPKVPQKAVWLERHTQSTFAKSAAKSRMHFCQKCRKKPYALLPKVPQKAVLLERRTHMIWAGRRQQSGGGIIKYTSYCWNLVVYNTASALLPPPWCLRPGASALPQIICVSYGLLRHF